MSAEYMLGQRIGDYRLDQILGEGGMGVVFKGVQERLGQIVAIKMLHPSLITEERLKSRFVREAQALARLNHPNVVRLLNFVNEAGNLFIVMEFMDGKAVDEVLTACGGVIPEIQAAEYFVQVLAAMHYAHSLGIIHRDIKPSNIAVLSNGGVKVLDFGTAKILGAQALTQEGMTLGTLIYMSPEQICGRDLDHRSDIYSLGVTLYEMVTGYLPHYSEDEMTLIREIATGIPVPPRQKYPQLSEDLARIILKAIQKDPAERYQTADEFLKDLNRYLKRQKQKSSAPDVRSTPPSGVRVASGADIEATVTSSPPPSSPGFRTGLLVGAVVCLLVFGGLGLWALLGARQPVLGAGSVGLGVVLALILGLRAAKGRKEIAPAAPPEQAFGEATVAFDDSAPPPGPPAGPAPAPPAFPPPAPQPEEQPGQTARDLELFGVQGQVRPAYLYILGGPEKGRSWQLPFGAVTIGRGQHNTIMLGDQGVSTSHAQIGFDGQRFVLSDLQSRNGCYVNRQRVGVSPLRDQDVVHIGTTMLGFYQPAA